MKRASIGVIAVVLACLPAKAETNLVEGEFATLQAVMQSYIEQSLVDGAMLHLDHKTGKVRELYPAKAHPMIMSLGKYYYLCTDFRDRDGKKVMVNFYAAKDHDRYVIFDTDFDASEELEHLVERNAEQVAN